MVDNKQPFFKRFKAKPIIHLIGIYAVLLGVLFFILQTRKLFMPAAAELEMRKLPFGLLDWGFVWADTILSGPLLVLGGLFILSARAGIQRLGKTFVFAGLAINTYAMIFFWIGYAAIGETVPDAIWGSILLSDPIFFLLCLLSMVYLALNVTKDAKH
ncbi:hypothetical protein JXI42_02965 [bacterium]|nr:hypothetical protein [bacterium]